jgi:integrase
MSAGFLGACICLHGTLDHCDHGDALVKGERADSDKLLFAEPDGTPTPPNRLTRRRRDACLSLGLPRVSFHTLRHTHASAQIADGLNVVVISRRLGHKDPIVTLNVYGHLFERDDTAAAPRHREGDDRQAAHLVVPLSGANSGANFFGTRTPLS